MDLRRQSVSAFKLMADAKKDDDDDDDADADGDGNQSDEVDGHRLPNLKFNYHGC